VGRPAKYASAAERQKAFRERYQTITARVEQRTKETLKMLSEHTDEPMSEVINSAIKYFVLNYNWREFGLFGKRLPRAKNPLCEDCDEK
jgi:hypothetical protein